MERVLGDQEPVSLWNPGLFSSDRQTWATPQALFDAVNEEFRFTLDAAASPDNAKCQAYICQDQDALAVSWAELSSGPVWLNPPYGRQIGKWIEKAYRESQAGLCVVCLVFARTDVKWWHQWAMKAAEIRLIPGRITFGGADNSAPAPSCLLVFDESRRVPQFRAARLPRS